MSANATVAWDPFLELVEAEDPAPLLHRLREEDPVHFVAPLGFGANLAKQEMGCMLDAALDIVTRGSAFREDLQEFVPMGLFKRPLNLPVQIA